MEKVKNNHIEWAIQNLNGRSYADIAREVKLSSTRVRHCCHQVARRARHHFPDEMKVCDDSMWEKSPESIFKKVLEAQHTGTTEDIDGSIRNRLLSHFGRDLSIDEIKEKIDSEVIKPGFTDGYGRKMHNALLLWIGRPELEINGKTFNRKHTERCIDYLEQQGYRVQKP